MNHDTHIRNIISQTAALVFDDFSRAVNVSGRLDLKDIEAKIKLAVECGRAIGYEQAVTELPKRIKTPESISITHSITKPVEKYGKKGRDTVWYPSITRAAKSMKLTPQDISRALRFGYYAGGYKWKYA
jgi:hypothetical protein